VTVPPVLVVDDNPVNVRLLAATLRAAGFDVETAASGAAALAFLERGAASLVLLDIQMPDMDGYEVLRRVREGPHATTPVVAVTSLAMVGDEEKARAAGFDAYVSKPIDTRTFPALVAGWAGAAPREGGGGP
jgi:CheY-like chemotaxis protein